MELTRVYRSWRFWISIFILCMVFPTTPAQAMHRTVSPAQATIKFDLSFQVPQQPYDDLLWTGTTFLYTTYPSPHYPSPWIIDGGPAGQGTANFAKVPNMGEMRCVLSSGHYGFPSQTVFCGSTHVVTTPTSHLASGIYAISLQHPPCPTNAPTCNHPGPPFAPIPSDTQSDGAIAVDTGGTFHHDLLFATGTSFSTQGGMVYTITPAGQAQRLGSYGLPNLQGGADNMIIAPPGFGPYAGDLLLAIDHEVPNDSTGHILAMDGHGTVTELPLDTLCNYQPGGGGFNPIVALSPLPAAQRGQARPGLYLSDFANQTIWFAPAAQFKPFTDGVLIGTEQGGQLYILQYTRGRYTCTALTTLDLVNATLKTNLEGAVYL